MNRSNPVAGASDLVIDLTHVSKTYRGRVQALRGIDMRVHRGEVFGLLGPNGAGKSTLVKIMTTVIRPTRADGTVLGLPVGSRASLARMGYLPEHHRFPRYLTGRQTLEFFGGLAGMPRAARRKRAVELLDVVGMAAWSDRHVGSYSKGMMQRVGLAQALMNDPDLVVLDEPTDGVDPVGRREIRDVLVRLRDAGKTVFINSHLLSELELICDRVAILLNGQVAKQGTLDELAVAKQRYEIELAQEPSEDLVRQAFAALGASPRRRVHPVTRAIMDTGVLPDGLEVEMERTTLRFGTVEPPAVQPLLDRLRAAGLIIRRMQMVRPSLEELFIDAVNELYQGARATAGANLANSRPVEVSR